MFFPRRPSIALAAALASALALAACSGGDGGGSDDGGGSAEPVSADQFEEAMSTPTELTFWTWVPDIENQVAMFEEAYPEIDVNVVNAGQGLDQYTALRTALRAGQGAPDVVQIEYQYISSFLVGGDLLDLSPYQGISDLESQYPEWVWEQVTRDGAVYGIPQDTGPMGLLYRDDLFAEAGVAPPTTWDEFAQAARTYREAKPDSYITDFPPNQAGQMIGLMWANGAQPFSYDGEETVSIDLDTPEVTEVVEYWQGLVQDELVAVDPDFTDQWYQGLSNGTYATWVAAAWGPVFLQGSAENTSGLWRAAQLPQWEAGGQSTGNWGGSTDAVVASSANPIAAAELARWINVEPEPALALATEQFLFPPSQSVLEDPAFIDAAPEFYGGQQVNQLFAEASEQVNTDFGWLPFMDYVYSSYEDVMGPAIADRGDMVGALAQWEQQLEGYAEEQGFTVE
ncbi:ABC transporter substrate-binding protein [Kineococcus terrestris]|uniref:ABC transporter substrate-binding protein n=1 Tax=Kineococcus terrestris TaxID=2044856 RepID=UPI0034DB5047